MALSMRMGLRTGREAHTANRRHRLVLTRTAQMAAITRPVRDTQVQLREAAPQRLMEGV